MGGWRRRISLVQYLELLTPLALLAALAVYPDGTYQRRYERLLVRGVAVLTITVPLLMLVARPTLEPSIYFEWAAGGRAAAESVFPDATSPLYVGAFAFLAEPLRAYFHVALTLIPLLGGILLTLRYRRSRSGPRLQVRWPLYGGMAAVVIGVEGLIAVVAGVQSDISTVIEIGALLIVTASLLIGLVKPDLFDIDRAMRRSLVYVPLWILIAIAYVGLAAALGSAASVAGLQLAIGLTIVATLLFEPARRYLVRRAAAWAYGESITGDEVVRRLGETLEHTLDLEQLVVGIAATGREGLGVKWFRIEVDGVQAALDGEPPLSGERPSLSAELSHGGQHLGTMECGGRVRGRRRPTDKELFATLAHQSALAIHNAQLAGELRRSLDEISAQAGELAASRSRIVAAQAAARRQIERDIHDGAQQDLAL